MNENNLIYYIDDLSDNIELFKMALSDTVHEVVGFTSAKACLETSLKTPPCIYISDVNMPQMNGYQLCQQLKLQNHLAQIPVLFVSTMDSVEDILKGYEVGGIDYISRPYNPVELSNKINSTLGLVNQIKSLKKRTLKNKHTAFKAMSDVQLMQKALSFVNTVHRCNQIQEIAKQMFLTLSEIGIVCSVYFRVFGQDYFFSDDGVERPLEKQLLCKLIDTLSSFIHITGRTKEFNGRMAITYDNTSLLIKNYSDFSKKDQLDIVATLLGNVNNRIFEIEEDIRKNQRRKEEISQIVNLSYQNLSDLNILFHGYEDKIVRAIDNMLTQMNLEFNKLDLIEEEEARLLSVVSQSMQQLTATVSQGIDLDQKFQHMIETFTELLSDGTLGGRHANYASAHKQANS